MPAEIWRKKPIEIQTVQFTGTGESCSEVSAFLGGSTAADTHQWKSCTNDGGYILTLEGRMEFKPGDWIIRGVQGEFYPCRDSIFRETYERVTRESV